MHFYALRKLSDQIQIKIVLVCFVLPVVMAVGDPCASDPVAPYPTPWPILVSPGTSEPVVQLGPPPDGARVHVVSDYGGLIQNAVEAAVSGDIILVDFPSSFMRQIVWVYSQNELTFTGEGWTAPPASFYCPLFMDYESECPDTGIPALILGAGVNVTLKNLGELQGSIGENGESGGAAIWGAGNNIIRMIGSRLAGGDGGPGVLDECESNGIQRSVPGGNAAPAVALSPTFLNPYVPSGGNIIVLADRRSTLRSGFPGQSIVSAGFFSEATGCCVLASSHGLASPPLGNGVEIQWVDFIPFHSAPDAYLVETTLPERLDPGANIVFGITFHNAGNTTWSLEGGYGLRITGDLCGLSEVATLGLEPGVRVAPGVSHQFLGQLRAPEDLLSCDISFIMQRSGVAFGSLLYWEIMIAPGANFAAEWDDYE